MKRLPFTPILNVLILSFRRIERRLTLAYLLVLTGLLVASGLLLISQDARAFVDRSINSYSNSKIEAWSSRLTLAHQLREKGADDEAARELKSLIEDIPMKKRGTAPARIRQNAMHNLGTLLSRTGDLDAAVLAFKQAADANPGSPEDLLHYGKSLLASNQINDARLVLHECLSISPKDYRAVRALAESYSATGEFKKAAELYSTYLDTFLTTTKTWRWYEDKLMGLTLSRGETRCGSWRFTPVVDGENHRYTIPMTRKIQFDKNGLIDTASITFRVIQGAGQLRLERIIFWGPVDYRTGKRVQLSQVNDWRGGRFSGLELIDDRATFKINSFDIKLEQSLSPAIDARDIDEIEIVCRLQKPFESECRARIEALIQQVRQGRSDNTPKDLIDRSHP